MQGFSFVLCIALLFIIAWEDFKHRAVHVIWYPMLFCALTLYVYFVVGLANWYLNVGLNLLFLAIQGGLLVLYFVLKHKKWVNITEHYIGWGDVFFLISVVALFTPLMYVLFYLTSLLAVVFVVLMYRLLVKDIKFIPLAGLQAVWLSLGLIYQQFISGFLFTTSFDSFFISNS